MRKAEVTVHDLNFHTERSWEHNGHKHYGCVLTHLILIIKKILVKWWYAMCTVNKSKVLSSYKRTGVTSGVTGGVGDRGRGQSAPQGRTQPHSPGWARVPLSSFFPQISINFTYFSSNFTCCLPHFGPPGGRLAHPVRPWLRHCAPETSDHADREIFADVSGKERQGKLGNSDVSGKERQGKLGKWSRKKLKSKKGRWKIENGRKEKLQKIGEDLFFFFFFSFHFSKRLKLVLGVPKREFSTGKKHFTPGKKIRKNNFAPSEKYTCYTQGVTRFKHVTYFSF